jgi:small subunit ribosomal protein S2
MINKNLDIQTVKSMIRAGVHCGHSVQELNPKMTPYIFGESKGIHIIDIFFTVRLLYEALNFVRTTAKNGGQFLLVGTNFQKSEFIARYALKTKCHYVNHKWLGGMLTNWATIQNGIKILINLELQEKNGSLSAMPKKESALLKKKLYKLRMYLNGIKYMTKLPDVVIVIDQHQDSTAIEECKKLGIPVIGIIDTNGDPNLVDIPIPANDDSISSVRCILKLLLEVIQEERFESDNKGKDRIIDLREQENKNLSKNIMQMKLRTPSTPPNPILLAATNWDNITQS